MAPLRSSARSASLPVLVLACAAASCGPSAEDVAGDAALRDGAALVLAFQGDLTAGRTDAALARTTDAFRKVAPAAKVVPVVASQTALLGALSDPGAPVLTDLELVPAQDGVPPRAAKATLGFDAVFEKGTARIDAVLVRGAEGVLLVDAWSVHGAGFTFTLR